MIIRSIKSEDLAEVQKMLKAEGVTLSAVGKPYSTTYVAENKEGIAGFFTITYKGGVFYLQHFVVSRKLRNSLSRTAYRMIKTIEGIFLGANVKSIVISLCPDRKEACKIVEKHFGARIEKTKILYLVRV